MSFYMESIEDEICGKMIGLLFPYGRDLSWKGIWNHVILEEMKCAGRII